MDHGNWSNFISVPRQVAVFDLNAFSTMRTVVKNEITFDDVWDETPR